MHRAAAALQNQVETIRAMRDEGATRVHAYHQRRGSYGTFAYWIAQAGGADTLSTESGIWVDRPRTTDPATFEWLGLTLELPKKRRGFFARLGRRMLGLVP
jgi:hypothetical protein